MIAVRALVAAGFVCILSSASQAQEDRGEYLARIMDCGGCHTPGYLKGQPDMARYLGGSDVGFAPSWSRSARRSRFRTLRRA